MMLTLFGHWYLDRQECDAGFYKHAAVIFHTEIDVLERDMMGYISTLEKIDGAIGELIDSDESGFVIQTLIRYDVGLVER